MDVRPDRDNYTGKVAALSGRKGRGIDRIEHALADRRLTGVDACRTHFDEHLVARWLGRRAFDDIQDVPAAVVIELNRTHPSIPSSSGGPQRPVADGNALRGLTHVVAADHRPEHSGAMKSWNDLSPRARRLIMIGAGAEGTLKAAALVDLLRRPAAQIRGSKVRWAVAIILINSLGAVPITYFLHGRRRA